MRPLFANGAQGPRLRRMGIWCIPVWGYLCRCVGCPVCVGLRRLGRNGEVLYGWGVSNADGSGVGVLSIPVFGHTFKCMLGDLSAWDCSGQPSPHTRRRTVLVSDRTLQLWKLTNYTCTLHDLVAFMLPCIRNICTYVATRHKCYHWIRCYWK